MDHRDSRGYTRDRNDGHSAPHNRNRHTNSRSYAPREDYPPPRGQSNARDGSRERFGDTFRSRRSQNNSTSGYGGGGGGFDRNSHSYTRAPRETGRVVSLKDAYGFIECAERNCDVFFHQSEVRLGHDRDAEISVGDDVEFTVSTRKGKTIATSVCMLERGSVTVDEVSVRTYKGIVTRDAKPQRSDDGELHGGEIQVHESERGDAEAGGSEGGSIEHFDGETIPFMASSIKHASKSGTIPRGSEVEFKVCMRVKTQWVRATEVVLLRTARQIRDDETASTLPTEQGKIVRTVNDEYGFIQSTVRRASVYFRFSEVTEPLDRRIETGQEVEYKCMVEPKQRGDGDQYRALRVKFLPRGTVVFEHAIGKDVECEVVNVPSDYSGKTGRLLVPVTAIEAADPTEAIEGDASKEAQPTPAAPRHASFALGDLRTAVPLKPGDTVTCTLAKSTIDGKLVGREVRICSLQAAGREVGVISTLKDGYGFIKCAQRREDAYFRFTDVVSQQRMSEGAAVKFDLGEASNSHSHSHSHSHSRRKGEGARTRAERIELLPEDEDVWFEKVIASQVTGTVAKDRSLQITGDMPVVAPEEEFPDIVRALERFAESGDDRLEVSLNRYDFRGMTAAAWHTCTMQREMGLRLNGGESLTVFKDPSRGGDADEPPTIDLTKVKVSESGVALQEGDGVTFDIAVDRRTQQRFATNITVTDPVVKPEDLSGTHRGVVSTINRSRHFGFINRENDGKKHFFHLSELSKGADQSIKDGDAVSFSISSRNGKVVAMDIAKLTSEEAATLRLKSFGTWSGVVTSVGEPGAPTSRAAVASATSGSPVVMIHPLVPETAEANQGMKYHSAVQMEGSAYESTDASDDATPALAPMPAIGHFVKFELFRNADGKLMAGNCACINACAPVTSEGKVQSMKDGCGLVALEGAGSGAENAEGAQEGGDGETPGSILLFRLEHTRGVVRANDVVQCWIVECPLDRFFSSHSSVFEGVEGLCESRVAIMVSRPGFVQGSGSPMKATRQRAIPKIQYREAKGPDGTLGFPAGWRSAKEE